MLEPGSYQQDRDRIKLALAKERRDSLAPADVGYYVDVLQGRLHQIAGKGMGVGREGDRILLQLSLLPGFEPESAAMAAPLRETLAPLSEVLAQYRMTLVTVHVRPEESGDEASRESLAKKRSLALARHLVEAGVAASRIVIGGPAPDPAPAKPTGITRIDFRIEPIVRDN